MHAGLLDVLHHRPDEHVARGIRHGVDVDLDGTLQEAVDQHRGQSGDASAAVRTKRSSSSASYTISMARPPRTYEGRTTTG